MKERRFQVGDMVKEGNFWYTIKNTHYATAFDRWEYLVEREGKSKWIEEDNLEFIKQALNKPTLNHKTDAMIEELWDEFANVGCDNDKIDEEWRWWPDGTLIEEIWKWFDKYHSKGIHYLLYERGDNP